MPGEQHQRMRDASIYKDGELRASARRRLDEASPFDRTTGALKNSAPPRLADASAYDDEGVLKIR